MEKVGGKEKEGGHMWMLPGHSPIPVCTVTPQQSPEDLPLPLAASGKGQGCPWVLGKLQLPLPTGMSQAPLPELPPPALYSSYSLGRVWN